MNEHSALTVLGQSAQRERVARSAELLRAELAPFVHAKALSEMLDLAARAAENTPVEDVLREMRATVAGILLNRVGSFMVATQVAIERAEPVTHRSGTHKRAAA